MIPSRKAYSVFGLTISSELELPELYPAPAEPPADVDVVLGPVLAEGLDGGLHAVGDALTLVVPEVANFRIEGGRRITADFDAAVPPRNVRLFLLGSAFGALLHQRGLLPLHANAIEIEGQAVAFMGHSGAGKSTLAAWFHDRGHRILADDVCVVRFDANGDPSASPGLPRLRLWLDVLELTGRELEGLDRSYIGGSAELDKFDVPVAPQSTIAGPARLAALYLLDRGDGFAIERLGGLGAAEAIFANTYRGAYVAATSTHLNHWRGAIALARATPVFRFVRPMDLGRLDADGEALLGHVRAGMAVAP
jgi:hypothetical protein